MIDFHLLSLKAGNETEPLSSGHIPKREPSAKDFSGYKNYSRRQSVKIRLRLRFCLSFLKYGITWGPPI
jgi:hypothetical protein